MTWANPTGGGALWGLKLMGITGITTMAFYGKVGIWGPAMAMVFVQPLNEQWNCGPNYRN